MAETRKRVFLWCDGLDNLFRDTGFVAGIQVQMSFWAKTFAARGWEVYSFSSSGQYETVDGVHFISQKQPGFFRKLHISFLGELLSVWRGIIKTKPDVVLIRGAQRDVYLLSIVCKLRKTKLVFMGASDVNFILGRDEIPGPKLNTTLYRRALKKTNYIVSQNTSQADCVKKYYNKESLIIPNIWVLDSKISCDKLQYDAIWVSNLSPVKQADWFLRLAEKLPKYRFALVGGSRSKKCYDEIKAGAKLIPNLDFLGQQSFLETTSLISRSRILVCTSEHEGFPNTFLQAWAMSKPVVSTVDPNSVITTNGLGYYVVNEEELAEKVETLIENAGDYDQCVENVKTYFELNHSSDHAFNRLIEFLYAE